MEGGEGLIRRVTESQRGAEPCAGGCAGGSSVSSGLGVGWGLELTRGLRSKSTLKALGPYVKEHYPNAAHGVYPIENDSRIAVVIVANKYSPNNFWYGAPGPGTGKGLTHDTGTAGGARSTSLIPRRARSRGRSRWTCTTTRTAMCGC